MGVKIGINLGRAFTAGVFVVDKKIQTVKVTTIPQKPVSSIMNCIEEGASKIGFPSAHNMLLQAETLNLSAPFIGKNNLNQKSGPKVGLIVTKGFEKNLYSVQESSNVALEILVTRDMVVGVNEEIDSLGRKIQEPEEEKIREAVKNLLERGAEVIVVSLRRAPLNPENEQKIRQIIETEYPSHYLGAVPIILSTEAGATLDDTYRTNAVLLNAYCQTETAKILYEAEDAIKGLGYTKTLRVFHSEGGVVRVCKSVPLKCINSDLAADSLALTEIGKLCDLQDIVALDIGGSNINVGFLKGNEYKFNYSPIIEGIPLRVPIIDFVSDDKGAHCVAKLRNGAVELGPENSEPACYGIGVDKPTVTDACVALGFIDSNYFCSRSELNVVKARQVIEDSLARPMGVPVEEAAQLVIKEVKAATIAALHKLVRANGFKIKHVTLLPLGGGSGIYCCDVAQELGIPRIYCPPIGWVFSALGCLFGRVIYSYEACGGKVLQIDAGPSEMEWFNRIVKSLENIAYRDMMAEGFSKDELSFVLELEVSSDSFQAVIQAPRLLETNTHIKALFENFKEQSKQSNPVHVLTLQLFRLRAMGPSLKCQFNISKSTGRNPQKAFVGEREIWMDHALAKVCVYRRELLKCGNVIEGPALIVSQGDTAIVPRGKSYAVDKFLGGVIS